MSAYKAFVKIKDDLALTFGEGLAARILFTASDKANVPMIGITETQFQILLRALESDERLRKMWGEHGTGEKIETWSKLV